MPFVKPLQFVLALATAHATLARAYDTPVMEEVIVEGRRTLLVGEARSASEGIIGHMDLALRPLLRPGDVLESIPGIVVTKAVDSCCGMGGSFGMKAAHYDLSAKIARKLWKEIDEADVDVVATECGTCMLQIEARQDTKGAVHPVVLLRGACEKAGEARERT